MALVSHERERLLKGNWNARPVAGSYFKRQWFKTVDVAPADYDDEVIYWDRASTEPDENNIDPDYTVGVKMGVKDGIYYVERVRRDRCTPQGVQRMLLAEAQQDPDTQIILEEDPGQAGVADVQTLIAMLAGYAVSKNRVTKAKEIRARPFSSQCEAGNVRLVRGRWNEPYLSELEGFPPEKDKGHDDQVDASSGAFNYLSRRTPPRVRSV
jgi:predicted phage terminase large subunit-like protein